MPPESPLVLESGEVRRRADWNDCVRAGDVAADAQHLRNGQGVRADGAGDALVRRSEAGAVVAVQLDRPLRQRRLHAGAQTRNGPPTPAAAPAETGRPRLRSVRYSSNVQYVLNIRVPTVYAIRIVHTVPMVRAIRIVHTVRTEYTVPMVYAVRIEHIAPMAHVTCIVHTVRIEHLSSHTQQHVLLTLIRVRYFDWIVSTAVWSRLTVVFFSEIGAS